MLKANDLKPSTFVDAGTLRIESAASVLHTLLGSCVSICLYDSKKMVGGMNHYMLPLWYGEGLCSPKYGNVAIPKLIERMVGLGCARTQLVAKVFGGGNVITMPQGQPSVGQRNIDLAWETLENLQIPRVASDVGGKHGRKVEFHTDSGDVYVRKVRSLQDRFVLNG